MLELTDVVGPISCIAPRPAFNELAVGALEVAGAIHRAAIAAEDELAATAAGQASVRLRNWPLARLDTRAAAELLRSYDAAFAA